MCRSSESFANLSKLYNSINKLNYLIQCSLFWRRANRNRKKNRAVEYIVEEIFEMRAMLP